MGTAILITGISAYIIIGGFVLQAIEKKRDRAGLAYKWQDSTKDKLLKLALWPLFAGAHYKFK